jgi:cell division initiation protein
MLTPLDIQNKEFGKSFRGYKETEVDSFLDEIIVDYEKIYKENIELKDKIGALSNTLKQYNNLEETLKNTLIVAQSTAEDVTNSAKKKSELIIEEAEINAKGIIEEAHEKVIAIEKEYEDLKKDIYVFKTRFKSLIEAQLSTLEEYYTDNDKDNNKNNDKKEIISNIKSENMNNSEEDINDLGA